MVNIGENHIDVSIIIVNYNNLRLLETCLDSIVKHSNGFVFEIIVVDNNTTEGDVELVASKYSVDRLIRNDKNLGFATANNQGIKIAKGDFILFLNNDTVFNENTIFHVLEFAVKKKHELFVGCKILNDDGSRQNSLFEFNTFWNLVGEIFFYIGCFQE